MSVNISSATVGSFVLAAAMLAATGCGPTVFKGQTGLKVVGTLPPLPLPPPPPPPPEPPKRVQIVKDKIVIGEKIQFEINRSVLMPASHSLLNEIAQLLKDNPQVKKVRIEGHASSEGDPQFNKVLSDGRARAVRSFLVSAGVDSKRLVSRGYGADKPIASNDTEEGRVKNRRVEFNITLQDKATVEADAEDANQ